MEQTSQRVSLLEHKFHLKERGTTVQTEVVAGTTTFLASLSIVVLNPLILSAAGMDAKAVFWATVVSAFIGCMWMGLWGNFPFALGPAMGLNSYLAFTVVQSLGLSWENGLACVFTSGCCFMLLSVFRVQQKIVDAIPDCVKKSIGAGVGMFIAFIGFQSAGLIRASESTLVELGDLGNPGTIMALLGIAVTAVLVQSDGSVPGAGKALFVSAGAAAIGAILGTSTVTIYGAESATGIAEGGRTGLTACTTGLLFLLTLFFSPAFLMIPAIATAPAVIMVGIFMMEPLGTLDLSDFTVAMPTFFAVAAMPFTYNIAYGVLFSLLNYTICQMAAKKGRQLSPTIVVLTVIFAAYLILDAVF